MPAVGGGMLRELGCLPATANLTKASCSLLLKVLGIAGGFFPQEEISGICISTAGMVDTEKGVITYAAPLIPDYAGTEYKKAMEERFGFFAGRTVFWDRVSHANRATLRRTNC